MMNTVICDIDGTLADCDHRRHHLTGEKKDWKSFNAAMHMDQPKQDIVRVVETFLDADMQIVLCSGREAVYRDQTEKWLNEHGIPYHALYMRAEKDYRDDGTIKGELLDQILADGYQPWLVLEDRDRCVRLWRSRGLTCLQVAEGNF